MNSGFDIILITDADYNLQNLIEITTVTERNNQMKI